MTPGQTIRESVIVTERGPVSVPVLVFAGTHNGRAGFFAREYDTDANLIGVTAFPEGTELAHEWGV